MEFANKGTLQLEPRAAVDMGTSGVKYSTPLPWRSALGGLALINGVTAHLKYKIATTGGAGTAEATLRVKTSGGVVLHEETISVANDAVLNGKTQVDVGAVSGGSPLLVEVEVTTAVASMTAELDSALEVETPVIAGGC
ncbi:hypothetical protein [Marinobacter adhaerens]|uniref:hypothetical protein n=1 Tax=Marinobacter adhaerens TaxID=1033846 RepID=UPI003D2B44D7